MTTARHHRAAGAFTLIELLVVITIVAVLAGMLMTALNSVRTSVNTLGCADHMRQYAYAFTTYAEENKRWPSEKWHMLLKQYVGDDSTAVNVRNARCPAVPLKNPNGTVAGATYAYTGVYWTSYTTWWPQYDPQKYFFAWADWLSPKAPAIITQRQMPRKAEKCMLSEYWTITATSSFGTSLLNDQRTRLAHPQRNNFAFADCHVQALPVGIKRFAEVQWAMDPMWMPYNPSASTRLQ
ncbi:MAG: prepilin-type N-terminal cleavage/methylation domain-containing protein [Planctomycetes bacterium]|nr:prepilin-type N-terminal cleavage/methylation domain-containing protein [Planctomycetota bacterium]